MTWLGKKEIGRNYKVPWYYGLAYDRFDLAVAVCYPVPINWLVWGVREAWGRLRWTPRGIHEQTYRDGFLKGKSVGYDAGYTNGYQTACEDRHFWRPQPERDDSNHPLNKLARGERV